MSAPRDANVTALRQSEGGPGTGTALADENRAQLPISSRERPLVSFRYFTTNTTETSANAA